MATQQQINDIAGLYVAYFDRAPDPAGLQFWIDQLDGGRDFATISQDFATSEEAKEIYPFLATPDLVNNSPAAFVTSIYANLFGRAPDQAGLNFWVDVIGNGEIAPGDMVEAVMMGAQDTLVNGELIQDKTTVENKIECALEFTLEGAATEGFDFDAEAYSAARQAIEGVDATDASVTTAKAATFQYFSEFADVTNFTLWPTQVLVSEAVAAQAVTDTVLYWGYNPHSHDETDGVDNLDGNNPDGNDNNLTNEGPEDGGIPADAFFGTSTTTGYLSLIAGQVFAGLDASGIDVDNDVFSTINFPNLRDISADAGDAGNGGVITFTYSDGSSDDIALGQAYYDFLCKLIFDEEGNSRFFEKEVAAQIPVYLDANGEPTTDPTQVPFGNEPIGYVDAFIGGSDAVYGYLPIMLTPTVNNGSTVENGFTTAQDDVITAGHLDMLHQAVIDGGLGTNTLNIEAKGEFAQPKALANLQYINIENLPNIYSTNDGIGANQAPDPVEPPSTPVDPDAPVAGNPYSVIDLSTADELRNVTISEGTYTGLGAGIGNDPGGLTVTGISNDATITFDGGFHNAPINISTSYTGINGPTFIFNNVNATATLNLGHNGAALTFDAQGVANSIDDMNSLFTGGGVSDLYIKGNASLFIESDLRSFLESDTPVTIDASQNQGGVDLNTSDPEQLTFIGSQGDDRLSVNTDGSVSTGGATGVDFSNDESVTITNAVGDNYYNISTYALDLTDGDGDVNAEIQIIQGTITLGEGDNHVEGQAVNLVATAGDGDNKFDIVGFDSSQQGALFTEDDFPTLIDLTAGDGSNIFNVFVADATLGSGGAGHYLAAATVNITAGDGGNLIQIPALPYDLTGYTGDNYGDGQIPVGVLNGLLAGDNDVLSTVTVNTGDGDDTIVVGGSTINISSGGGDDTITLMGIDNDYVTEVASLAGGNGPSGVDYGYSFPDPEDGEFNFKGFTPSIFGAELDIDTGAGSATINLGAYNDDAGLVSGAIVAKEGSVITGSDITLFVNTHADLRAADLSGITAVIMDDDKYTHGGQGFPAGTTSVSESASLTLLDTQFAALGQSVFSTQGETFGAQSTLTIVITSDTTLSQLIDFSSWNDSVKLCFVVEDGATLTLSAEELHRYVAPEGIAVDESNAYIDNQVVITDAGFLFDPFADQFGGTGGGTLAGSLGNQDIDIIYTPNGYERPSQDPSTATITIDSDVTPLVGNVISPFANAVVIEGDADLEITGRVDLANNFTIDFTGFNGEFPENADGVEEAFTVYNFQEITFGSDPYDWGRIDGNGTEADPVRVNVVMQDGTTVGDVSLGVAKGGFNSSGVQQYIFTDFVDSQGYIVPQATGGVATIVVCDHTEDLEVLGLQNNRASTITFEQVNWGTQILMEGDGYADASDQEKNLGDPDLSEIGYVNANFFEAGANAHVRITNQGTELGLNEDAEDGFDPTGERWLDVDGVSVFNADRLLIDVEDGDAYIKDVSGIDVERVIVNGPEDVKIVVNGVADLSMSSITAAAIGQGLDSTDLLSIDGSGVAGEFSLCLKADADLSGVTLTGIDALTLLTGVSLTLTADQAVVLGPLIESADNTTTLNIVDMADQPLDLSAIDVGDIGSVTFVGETVTVDPTTDFGDADVLVIPEDGQITMTMAQFNTADGGDDGQPNVIDEGDTVPAMTETAADDVVEGMANEDNNKLILTDVPNGDPDPAVVEVELTDVSAHVDVDVVLNDFVANANFNISATGGETTTLVLSGTTDMSAMTVANLGTTDCIKIADGAVVTLSQTQIQGLITMTLAIEDVIKVEGTATLNINGIDGLGTPLLLDDLVDAYPGLDIGTLTLADTNVNVTLSDGTTDWTMGSADEIVTPTADLDSPEFGLERTSLTLTANQFHDLDGIGFISGEGVVNIIDVAHNNDGPDAGIVPDTLLIDTTGITAPKGEMRILENGAPTVNGETLFLNTASDVSGFEIILTDGQLWGFATEGQASGATVTEQVVSAANPTGIVWLFDTWSGTEIDTANYDAAINTLFVYDSLVNGNNEEAIWSTLASSIDVH